MNNPIKKGLPASGIDYQPYWGGDHSNPHERDSTPERAKQLMDALKPIMEKILVDWDMPLSLLDLGCNNGYFVFEFLKTFPAAKAVGLDYHQPAIDVANKIADNFHETRASFQLCDLNNWVAVAQRMTIYRPTIIFALSIFHHLNDPIQLASLCDLAAPIIVIEYQHKGEYGEIEPFLVPNFIRMANFTTYYSNQTKDVEGEQREIVIYADHRLCDKREHYLVQKWLNIHDSNRLMGNIVQRYHIHVRLPETKDQFIKFERGPEGDSIVEVRNYISGDLLLDHCSEIPQIRKKLLGLLWHLGDNKTIHGDLLCNILVDHDLNLQLIDKNDTAYDIGLDWNHFYIHQVRFMKHFHAHNPICQIIPRTQEQYCELDLLAIEWLLNYFHLEPLSASERATYYAFLNQKRRFR